MASITADQDAALRRQLAVLHVALREAGIRSLLVGRHSLHLTQGVWGPAQRQSPYLVVFVPNGEPGRRLRVTVDGGPGAAFCWPDDRGLVRPVLDPADAVTAI